MALKLRVYLFTSRFCIVSLFGSDVVTVTSRLSTQLDLEVALRTYAGGAYLTVLCPIARTVCVHGQYIGKCV